MIKLMYENKSMSMNGVSDERKSLALYFYVKRLIN